MALTIGTGPFGEHPAGHFDVVPPATPLLFWEPFPKRLRIVMQEEVVADSTRVLALHETGEMMRLCVPWSDIRANLLLPGEISTTRRLGPVRSWFFHNSRGTQDAAVWSLESPPLRAKALERHLFFDFDKVDEWYLEDDLGYAHPRDPYHRFDVHRSSHHVVVHAGGAEIAQNSAPAMLFETSMAPRVYLPPNSVDMQFLEKSETVSRCPYKGDGQHWHVVVGHQRIVDAGWSLTTPMGDALTIPGWFSFYPEKLSVQVDGRSIQS